MEWKAILQYVLLGLTLGTLVSGLNHLQVWFLMKNYQKYSLSQIKSKLKNKYKVRFFTNILVLALVYKNTGLLIGTAIGLIIVPKLLVLNYTLLKRG